MREQIAMLRDKSRTGVSNVREQIAILWDSRNPAPRMQPCCLVCLWGNQWHGTDIPQELVSGDINGMGLISLRYNHPATDPAETCMLQ